MILKEVVVVAIIAILAIVFVACLALFVYLCRAKLCKRKSNKEVLIQNGPPLELGDFRLHPDIEQILTKHQLLDTSGLEPHCLAILRSCHKVTENLAAVAMSFLHKHKMKRVAEVARQTSDRVDDVVRSMYPPVDARLLEARATTLVLTVSHLATLMHFAYKQNPRVSRNIEQELTAMEPSLLELRSAASQQDKNAIAELHSTNNLNI